MPNSQNGWPIDPARSARTVPGTNIRIVVADGPAGDVLMHVAARFDATVEDIDTATGGVLDDWGYAHRPIAGSNVWSNHASGTAIDLNATRHVQGKRGSFSSAQVAAIRVILSEVDNVVRWGGDYTGSSVDEMHFEINADAARVAAVAARLGGNPAPPPTPPSTGRPTIRRGSTGPYVLELQKHMNRVYPLYSHLAEDGIFGAKTETVVREFQRRAGIAVDGIVGPITWRTLGF